MYSPIRVQTCIGSLWGDHGDVRRWRRIIIVRPRSDCSSVACGRRWSCDAVAGGSRPISSSRRRSHRSSSRRWNPSNGSRRGVRRVHVVRCDRSHSRSLEQARSQVAVLRRSAGQRALARVDRRLTRAAAWVPLVNPKGAELVSERVGNYSYSPVTGMILSQIWVN